MAVYEDILRRLADAGAKWVQVDEPALGPDLSPDARAAFMPAYSRLGTTTKGAKICLATELTRAEA